MARRISALFSFALAVALLPGCGGSTGPEVLTVASIRVTPELTLLDLGGTAQLTAVALTDAGDPIPDAVLEWRSLDPSATVDAGGRVAAVSAGVARIEVSSSDGPTASAEVRVSPVAGLSPDTGRYGAVVAIEGDDVLANATVRFTGPGGETVPASIRSAGPGALEVWVPVGAASGPLELEWPGGSAETVVEFVLTADSDVLAGGATVPFPYRNPSLLADAASPHAVSFTLAEEGPFALELSDHGPRDENTAVRAWLFRTDVEPSVLLSFVMTRDLAGGGAVLDSATYSRASLPAGDYTLLVAPMDLDDPDRTDVTRSFGLRLEPAARFGRAPDAYEPNDYPGEAPVTGLPLSEADPDTGPGFETPYGMDHYAFDVGSTSTVTITTEATGGLILVYLLSADVTDILEAWESDRVLASVEDDLATQTVSATLAPGRYTVLVWDWAGRARPYALDIDAAEPGAPGVPVTSGIPSARAAIVRPPWRPSAPRTGPGR